MDDLILNTTPSRLASTPSEPGDVVSLPLGGLDEPEEVEGGHCLREAGLHQRGHFTELVLLVLAVHDAQERLKKDDFVKKCLTFSLKADLEPIEDVNEPAALRVQFEGHAHVGEGRGDVAGVLDLEVGPLQVEDGVLEAGLDHSSRRGHQVAVDARYLGWKMGGDHFPGLDLGLFFYFLPDQST